MSTKRIRWVLGGLNVPGIGKTESGVVYPRPLPKSVADNLIKQGIAEEVSSKRKEKPKDKGGKD